MAASAVLIVIFFQIVRPSKHPDEYWVCFFKKAATKKTLMKLEEKEFFAFLNEITIEIKDPVLEAFGSRIYYNFSYISTYRTISTDQ